MSDSQNQERKEAVAQAIALADTVLRICDEHGFVFAAIDISCALDKLKAIQTGEGCS